MDAKELLEALRYQPGNMAFSPQIRLKVADKLEELLSENKQLRNDLIMQTALAQNGQSAIETNKQLSKRICALLKDIKELAVNSDDGCNYCKYNQPCEGENCEYYTDGVGLTDENGNYVNWHWTCMDFEYGTCPKLENTPCNGCFENKLDGFEWRGSVSSE